MNFNRVLFLLPLFILTGCSSGEYAEASAGTTGSETTTASSPELKLTSTKNDPAMKAAAVKRAVIRNGSLTVRVPNVEEAERKVNDYVTRVGGFVGSSDSSDLATASPTIRLSVRVPASGFDASMKYFESLGVRLSKSVRGEDVTSQLVDFEARLKIMRAQEDSFRNMLAKATNTSTASDLQSRIMELRAQIESLAAQRAKLADLAALSTFDLTLVGESKGMADHQDNGWAQESWNSSTSMFVSVFRGIGSFLIFAVVFSPFWIPVAILLRRSMRKGVPRLNP